MISIIFICGVVLLVLAYRFYGKFLTRQAEINDSNTCPSKTEYDGVDYVPTNKFVLLGHHFSSIAGAGPIVGPVIGAILFGWGPALLWIVIGSILIGGVQDFMSMIASVRNKGRSVAELARTYLSPFTYRTALVFIWVALVYVIVVFADLTKASFIDPITVPGSTETIGKGAVATSSVLLIAIAIIFGLVLRRIKTKAWIATIPFVILLFGTVVVGNILPIDISLVFQNEGLFWLSVLLIYAFIASVSPVWVLLQPRDYLSSFLLYATLIGGGLGLVFGIGTLTGSAPITDTFFKGFTSNQGAIFPILFITIACGACSGFHSLVSSGTSAKQLEKESDAKAVGYGGMLLEGVLALMALATVILMVSQNSALTLKDTTPLAIFSGGMGQFFGILGIPQNYGTIFAQLAISTFLLTTLDTCTRLARYIYEEFFNLKRSNLNMIVATLATLALPIILLILPEFIPAMQYTIAGVQKPLWSAIWPIFGATNQLLGAVALIVLTVWLKKSNKHYLYVLIPMVFMTTMTVWAFVETIYKNIVLTVASGEIGVINVITSFISIILVALAIITVIDALIVLIRRERTGKVGIVTG